jgi:hypothetical protein
MERGWENAVGLMVEDLLTNIAISNHMEFMEIDRE